MKTIIFSDTHLDHRFDNKRFTALKSIISKADQIIINGDFWDSIFSNKRFVNSKWQNLFPLLKKKHTIYIFGNHDEKRLWKQEDLDKFSDKQTDEYILKSGNMKFIICHGHSITPTITKRYLTKDHNNYLLNLFWRITHKMQLFIYWTVYTFYLDKILLFFYKDFYRHFKYQNNTMKKYANGNLKENEFLICGHSHLSEIDKKNQYANTGFINHNRAQYLQIENGKIKLIDKKY